MNLDDMLAYTYAYTKGIFYAVQKAFCVKRWSQN
jgi:hypothetical protein